MNKKIIVTGATGFIGSNLLAALEAAGWREIVAVDGFGADLKWKNVAKRSAVEFVDPSQMWSYLSANVNSILTIVHLGAISSTTVTDADAVMATNYRLTIDLFNYCRTNGIRLIYASSAATYGDGSQGFDDSAQPDTLCNLRPLNVYGWSKNQTDLYIARHGGFAGGLPGVTALRFFNVYGPNEYHKGSQRSVVATFYDQLRHRGAMKLFRSTDHAIADGCQCRDFVYVDDCVDVIMWMIDHPDVSGIFNVGTGSPATFNDVARAVASAMGVFPMIDYIDMPDDVARHYQNYTCADLSRLRAVGYLKTMTPISDGVRDYVTNYLTKQDKFK